MSARTIAIGGAVAALALCGTGARFPARGVVIVTLDTTRADRVSPYGLMDSPMPALERLARDGVVFDRALSVAPLTLPAHASLFTGLLPLRHGVRDNADAALAPQYATLAELLRTRGYRTGAFVGSVVLNGDRGLARGFEAYGEVSGKQTDGRPLLQRRGDEVVSEAIRWLDRLDGEPFFLWVHLFDPHRPYDPPEPYAAHSADAYVGEIRFADAQIGRLIDALETRRLLDGTTMVVAGDHGESLGEHDERDHGVSLYESVLRVPLIVSTPGVQPRRVPDVVRLIDVMPTVLDLAGIVPPAVDGLSLRDLMYGRREPREREAYAESVLYPQRLGRHSLRALRDRRFTFIDAPEPELYDLLTDPFEARNLAGDRPQMVAAMRGRIAELTRGDPRRRTPPPVDVPIDVRERLAALGYR